MNRLHHVICRSASWRRTLTQRVPWVLSGSELGTDLLEIGPGPGLTTDALRASVPRLTALEIDDRLAHSLHSRLGNTNVEVVKGDATAMPFSNDRFSSAVAITMLHHVPSRELQDKLFREVWRVLKPGGVFLGSDSLQNLFMRVIHLGDTLVPIDPESVRPRLTQAGFEVLQVEKNSRAFRFYARKPATCSTTQHAQQESE